MPRKSPAPKPSLAVVESLSARDQVVAPKGLGEHGLKLWREVTSIYAFDDPGSLVVLEQACRALDRAERCAAEITEAGEMIRLRNGSLRANPLLRDELGFRAFAVRALAKLGLDLEPLHPTPGRPSGRGAA